MIVLDFDGLEQHGQTGRCHHHVGGDLFGPENAYFASANIGSRQKKLDRSAFFQSEYFSS
jgi:hypothetical protein